MSLDERAEYLVTDVTSTEDYSQVTKAKEVGDYLNQMYPGHLWFVCWQGGALVVKNMAMDTRYGFILKDNSDPKVMRHNAMIAGGELIERAGLRQRWDGALSTSLDKS